MWLPRGRALALFVAASGIAACHDWSSLSSQYGSDSGSGAPVCVAFVVTGDTGTCARRGDGSLLCWGDNRYGQLGVGDDATHAGPQEVIAAWPGVAKVYLPSGTGDLTASQSVFACSIDTSAGFWCWGDNTFGQLGDGTMTQHPSPTRVALQNDAGTTAGVQRACVGASHTCAVTSDGNIWCWGNNASGQLGTGDTMPRSMPTRIDNSMLGTQITSLQCGAQHTCAVTAKPALWCWGSNAYGQLGVGDTMDRSTPTLVKLPTTVGRVGTGGTYTCAFDTLGAVWCWGNGASGQLGIGNTSNQSLPMQVSGLPAKVTQVWTGGAHACVLDTTNSLWCWGDNQYGQLGTGNTTMHPTPVQPSTVPAQKIAGANAGGDHTCAVLLDGSVQCWGNDQYGQLGVPMQTGQAAVQVEPHCP